MSIKIFLGISLALVMVTGSIPLGFSESLQDQIEKGLETNQLQCENPNHVLVLRTNGNPACVSERTADRMKWEIVETKPVESESVSAEVEPVVEIPIEGVVKENQEIKIIDYWLPIPDDEREDFAKKFVAATGGSIIEEKTKWEYKTDPFGSISLGEYAVIYRVQELDIDATQTEKFVRDFMDYMEFEYEEENFHYREIPYHTDYPNYERQSYLIESEYSKIQFEFSQRFDGSFTITFTGWSNNPESIIFTISKEEALQYAEEFSNDLEGNLNLLYGDEEYEYQCELLKEPNPDYPREIVVNKIVISGIPYYVSEVGVMPYNKSDGSCGDLGLGAFFHILLHQDAVNGTDIFIEHGPSGE